MSTDYAVERVFNEFFCKENFIDYLIVQTFFAVTDWPHNNTRMFRAITPNIDSDNPYNDGRWRFVFHDLDSAGSNPDVDLFPRLYNLHIDHPHHTQTSQRGWLQFNHIYKVFNNPGFTEVFVERALYVLDNYLYQDRLFDIHNEFTMRYMPLLPEMYNRFARGGTQSSAIANFHTHWLQLRRFIMVRDNIYREQLNTLLERLNLQ